MPRVMGHDQLLCEEGGLVQILQHSASPPPVEVAGRRALLSQYAPAAQLNHQGFLAALNLFYEALF